MTRSGWFLGCAGALAIAIAMTPVHATGGVIVVRADVWTARLGWGVAAGANHYAVTRGALHSMLPGSYGVCFEAGVMATESLDDDLPAPNGGYAYLVHGVNAICGAGPLGSDSTDVERINENPGAPPCT